LLAGNRNRKEINKIVHNNDVLTINRSPRYIIEKFNIMKTTLDWSSKYSGSSLNGRIERRNEEINTSGTPGCI